MVMAPTNSHLIDNLFMSVDLAIPWLATTPPGWLMARR